MKVNIVNFLFVFLIVLLGHMTVAVAEDLRFVGVTEPAYDVELSFPIDGVIAKRFVEEGDSVKKGDPLLRLDDRLQKLESKRREVVWRNRSRLDAELKKQKIVRELLRSTKALYRDTGSISEDEVKRLEIQSSGISGEVNQLIAENKKEKIELSIARDVLSRHTLRSPISGTITDVFISEGEWVRTGKKLVRIVDTSICYIEVNMDEKYARKLKKGRRLDVYVHGEALKDAGEIVFVSPVADPASYLVRVKVKFINKTGITPGVIASIHLPSLDQPSPDLNVKEAK